MGIDEVLCSVVQDQVIEPGAEGAGDVELGRHSGEELLRYVANFDVRFLGTPGEDVECSVGGDAVDEHEHAFGLLDRSAGAVDFGDGFVDRLFDGAVESVGDIDVETGTTDDRACIVEEAVTDDHHRMCHALGVHDPVSTAERTTGGADRVQCLGHMRVVVGMFV